MAAIGTSEIRTGLVAFLDPCVLAADSRVCNTQDPPVTRRGPFLCVASEGGLSTWTCLTTEPRPERIELEREWRSGGHVQWLRETQYLNDGANLWQGPDETFAAASYREFTSDRNRARLSPEGLAAVLEEIAAQRGRRDRSCQDQLAAQASSTSLRSAGS